MKRLLPVIFLFLFSGFALADEVKLGVKVDKDTITIGDRITYEVDTEHEDGIELEPHIFGANLGEFEIKYYRLEEPEKISDNKWLSRAFYIITTFTTGEFSIPPVTVKYKDQKGNEKTVASEEIKIKVESVKRNPDDKDDIRPLKGPVEIRQGFPLAALAALWLTALLTVAGLIYFKKKKKTELAPPRPPRPPEEIAMEELETLREKRLIEKGMVKEYYIEISDIIRKYIEGRFRVFALDRTTWELYREMREKKIQKRSVDRIKDFLEDCDLVKFAKYIPEQKEIETAYTSAKEIVEVTKSETVS